MPKVDMDQESGTVVEWYKENGEEVEKGEIILVIETDKVAVDVESPGEGILNGIVAKPGQVFPIGTVIAYILSPGEELPKKDAPVPTEIAATTVSITEKVSDHLATPVAINMAARHGIDLSTITPSGMGQKITKADVEAQFSRGHFPGSVGKAYATPAARRVAGEKGVELDGIRGSGPNGRIQAGDVLALINYMNEDKLQTEFQMTDSDIVPLIGIRRTIAERMTASYQNAPHINFTSRVDMTQFIEAREKLNAIPEKNEENKVTATAMFVKLVANTLSNHPFLNSSLKGEFILLHRDINIGIAVALDIGLIVPVVKQANLKEITEISAEVNDLVTRAREGTLTNPDVKGGTFTISNLGPFGIEQFDAIINPPEAAILAIGATQLEAIPTEEGQIISCPMMRMTLSTDHRIVDGAVAARFVADLISIFEEPIPLTN